VIRRVTLPAIDERFAYFLGFLLGDGCLGRLSDPYLKLVGDLVDERDYYDRFLVPLILGLFGIGVRPRIRKGQQAYEIAFARKQLIEYLVSKIGLPGWVRPNSFLRLFANQVMLLSALSFPASLMQTELLSSP